MKLTSIGLLIGLILGLVIGFFVTKYLIIGTVPTGYVCVTVKNKSGHQIKSVVLKYTGGNMETELLNNNNEENLIFKNSGENTYKITVTFDNDSTLTNKEMYVEEGYKTTETIYSDHIKSENN